MAQVAVQLLAFVTSVAIARLLTPSEVGLVAMALVFGSLALVIVDFGLMTALIQRPTLTEVDKSTAFWAGNGIGLLLALLGVGLSWPIAALYGEPEVQPLFAVLSLSFLLVSPGIVQGALLTRELDFRSLELRTIVATAVSCVVAIALAALGFGPWALIAQSLTIAGVSTLLLWRASPWRPRAYFSLDSLRGIARFASHVFGSNAVLWATVNIDNLLIGRFLGPAPLGAYTLAFSVMITPVKRIAVPVENVLFPAFSRVQDPARIAGMWMRASRMIALLVAPAMLGLVAVAPDLVPTVFGEKWDEAIPVMQILAPVGLVQALAGLNAGILQSLALTRTLFRFHVGLAAATVAGFAAGLPWGLVGVATAYLLVTAVLQPVFLRLTARALGVTARAWYRSVSGVLEAGLLMLVIIWASRELLLAAGLSMEVRLAVLIAVGAVTYVPLVLWRDPSVLDEVRTVWRRRREDAPEPADGNDGPVSEGGPDRASPEGLGGREPGP